MNQKTSNYPPVIAIVGPTASGKTQLAVSLAEQFNGELISADSRQVYRGLDIGTGKEGQLKENQTGSLLASRYCTLRYINTIPQWLTDIVEPTETYTVAQFQQEATAIVNDVHQRGKVPILVGGTGLYITALLEGYSIEPNQKRHTENPRHATPAESHRQKPNWNVLTIGIDLTREELYQRIDARLDARVDQGLVEEARSLHRSGISLDRLRQFGLEYRFLADYLDSLLSHDEFVEKLKYAIHAFARRQLTWFRHHGEVVWIKNNQEAVEQVSSFLQGLDR